MTRDGRRQAVHISALRDVNGLPASITLKEDFSGTVEQAMGLSPV
jgi:hypothetical protein